ncbi:MAG: hypothetical protein JWN56_1680 [Sphingobacteriales bacterium]|nr:hypothetical protein [Sphingobacteriales bacterium]
MKQILFLSFFVVLFKLGFSQGDVKNSKAEKSKKTTELSLSKEQAQVVDIPDSSKLTKTVQMVKVAEVNNYPDPCRVIEISTHLKLTPAQLSKLTTIKSSLEFKAKEMDGFINQQEKKLNDLFASGKAEEGSIIYYTNKLGLYEGELRNAYLQAHLKTRYVLTPAQLKKYNQLESSTKKSNN